MTAGRASVVVVAVLGAALAIAACGSSDDAGSGPSTQQTTGAEEDVLQRLPELPEATESTRPPASADGTGGSAFLTDVFDDAQAMWREEFEAAGVDYTPAT